MLQIIQMCNPGFRPTGAAGSVAGFVATTTSSSTDDGSGGPDVIEAARGYAALMCQLGCAAAGLTSGLARPAMSCAEISNLGGGGRVGCASALVLLEASGTHAPRNALAGIGAPCAVSAPQGTGAPGCWSARCVNTGLVAHQPAPSIAGCFRHLSQQHSLPLLRLPLTSHAPLRLPVRASPFAEVLPTGDQLALLRAHCHRERLLPCADSPHRHHQKLWQCYSSSLQPDYQGAKFLRRERARTGCSALRCTACAGSRHLGDPNELAPPFPVPQVFVSYSSESPPGLNSSLHSFCNAAVEEGKLWARPP